MASASLPLQYAARGYMRQVLNDLLAVWKLDVAPLPALVPRNGMRLKLRARDREVRLRLFAYKVSSSGRNRPHERRVEITSTYSSGVARLPGYRDVVLGVDSETGRYVGVDARRLAMGGETHNASSFFDLAGLESSSPDMVVMPRKVTSRLFPRMTEHHAFFDRARLSEYLFSLDEIHSGTYSGRGPYSGRLAGKTIPPVITITADACLGSDFILVGAHDKASAVRSRAVSAAVLEAIERNDLSRMRRSLSPSELKYLQSVCEEVGAIGEQHVLEQERRRLRRAGHPKSAAQVKRVSLDSVSCGYDILSFENDGKTKRYVEVKATVGRGMVIDLSLGEWKAAKEYGNQYLIARVVEVRGTPRIIYVRDPVALDATGAVGKSPNGWRVDLTAAPCE